jgi:ArsR family transcriptional regulator, repressor of sdpIR and other operons
MEGALARRTARRSRARVKLVKVIVEEEVAKVLSDPMRRAILNILRERPMTEAGLAHRLGLTDATINYHLRILKKWKLVTITRQEVGEHGILQKFYLPSSYLYLPDIENLDPEAARYYLPTNIERVRGALSTAGAALPPRRLSGTQVDFLGEEFAKLLVRVAMKYEGREVEPGTGESAVNEIYFRAFKMLVRRMSSA